MTKKMGSPLPDGVRAVLEWVQEHQPGLMEQTLHSLATAIGTALPQLQSANPSPAVDCLNNESQTQPAQRVNPMRSPEAVDDRRPTLEPIESRRTEAALPNEKPTLHKTRLASTAGLATSRTAAAERTAGDCKTKAMPRKKKDPLLLPFVPADPEGLSPVGVDFLASDQRLFIENIGSGKHKFHHIITKLAAGLNISEQQLRVLPCLFLAEAFGFPELLSRADDSNATELSARLLKMITIAHQARFTTAEGTLVRGIPMTQLDSYEVFRRGGPAIAKRTFTIEGVAHAVVPPGRGQLTPETANSMQNFELLLLDVHHDADPISPDTELFIKERPGIKKRLPHWVERKPQATQLTEAGIPGLSAPLARELLKAVLPPKCSGWNKFITEAPRSFFDEVTGAPAPAAQDFFLDVCMGAALPKGAKQRRILKLALARLLWEPLDHVEREIFDLAVSQRSEQKKTLRIAMV